MELYCHRGWMLTIEDKNVLEIIADQTDGGKASIKKRIKKYNFKNYN